MASKPYVASRQVRRPDEQPLPRLRFDPTKAVGDDACPFTTLYWDFLLRHAALLRSNVRLAPQLKNALGKPAEERAAIATQAARVRAACRGERVGFAV
jgi:deoxyribodipyrimidine photolyase-related protein